ncbi:hypothetical protein [Actinoplanes solisilvae]|uniref:hypothetical protein n=1 Tax=Actinoplanes solisilvae TaxID=2486853 RepID=UPI00196B8C0E|nr:hypothetical protein [Actinoplanes solisilvae]
METSGADEGGQARRILLVEDDRELGELLVRLFERAGYAAELARDGQAGLHLGLTRCYDALRRVAIALIDSALSHTSAGGTIEAAAVPGRGAAFLVRLPAGSS